MGGFSLCKKRERNERKLSVANVTVAVAAPGARVPLASVSIRAGGEGEEKRAARGESAALFVFVNITCHFLDISPLSVCLGSHIPRKVPKAAGGGLSRDG